MSNTRRAVQPGWGIRNPKFRKLFPKVKSDKHQQRDRGGVGKKRKFAKGCKNTRSELTRKSDDLRLRDELEG